MGLADVTMDTLAVELVPTVIVIALDSAGLPEMQDKEEIKVTVTLSPSFRVLLV